jgi:hypothetical protein
VTGIPEFRKQENPELETSLGNTVRPCLKKQKEWYRLCAKDWLRKGFGSPWGDKRSESYVSCLLLVQRNVSL